MDRVKIKESAKQKIKGNIWNLLWPLLIIGVLEGLLNNIFGGSSNQALVNLDLSNLDVNAISDSIKATSSPISFIINIIFSVINIAYLKYVLDFVRTGKFDANSIIECLKTKWLNLLIVSLITGIATTIGFMLLIVPGVIVAIGLGMAGLIVIDSDLSAIDAIKKSWEMMKGYKWNYFVFLLSFLGWIILAPFTLFILFIWLIPYMTVAEVLYYEELKKITK